MLGFSCPWSGWLCDLGSLKVTCTRAHICGAAPGFQQSTWESPACPPGGDRASSTARVHRPSGRSVMGSNTVFIPVKGCHPQSVSQREKWDQKVSADDGGETQVGICDSSQTLQGTHPNEEKGLFFPVVPCPLGSTPSCPLASYPNLPLLSHPTSSQTFPLYFQDAHISSLYLFIPEVSQKVRDKICHLPASPLPNYLDRDILVWQPAGTSKASPGA